MKILGGNFICLYVCRIELCRSSCVDCWLCYADVANVFQQSTVMAVDRKTDEPFLGLISSTFRYQSGETSTKNRLPAGLLISIATCHLSYYWRDLDRYLVIHVGRQVDRASWSLIYGIYHWHFEKVGLGHCLHTSFVINLFIIIRKPLFFHTKFRLFILKLLILLNIVNYIQNISVNVAFVPF